MAVLQRNPTWFRKLNPSEPWSIMGSDEAAHARFKRAFMPAFTDKALHDHAHVLESNVDLFIRRLHDHSKETAPIDLVSWFNFLTFDISGALSFGESFGSTASGRPHPWVSISCAFGKGVAMIASLNFLGLTGGPFAKLLKYAMPEATRSKMVYHKQLTEQKVASYLASPPAEQNAPFLNTALQFNNTNKHQESNLTNEELNINMSIIIFAGSETTSSALSAILRYLLQNPTCLKILITEIRSSFPSEDSIKVNSINKLPYLTACINESLRMGPPVVIGLPRIIPKGGAMICGRLVPEGVRSPPRSPPKYTHLTRVDIRSPKPTRHIHLALKFPRTR